MDHGLDTSEFRDSAHYLADFIADYLESVDKKPLFPTVHPDTLSQIFDELLPVNGKEMQAVLRELEEKLMPYCTHVNHPGYMGLITPSPNPAGILGDFLASALNQNLGVFSIGPSAVTMERQVIRWLTDLAGYGPEAGGNLTSGGMTANFIGLKLARDFTSGDSAQYHGLQGKWKIYVSEERHISMDKSVDAIGLGRENLALIATNEQYQIDIPELERQLNEDKLSGYRPLCVVGLAGTTNLGAIDDLAALREICDREKCWLHADAAYGGGVLLSQKHRGILHSLNKADSITIDPHKWFYAPLDAGAILVKDHNRLTASFGLKPAYLTDQTAQKEDRYAFYEHGFEQSKRFRSLKVWMSFKRYGSNQIGTWIESNIDQALYLHELIQPDHEFESAMRPGMSAICIGFRGTGLSVSQADRLHFLVSDLVEKEGKFWFGTTRMKNKTWFRINPVNLFTTKDYMKELYEDLRNHCRDVRDELLKARGCAKSVE